MNPLYNHVLIIGATSGIGAALAARFIQSGSKVTATGRRVDRLEAFVTKHGKERASYMEFDLTDTKSIVPFVQSVTTKHPDIDCIISNAAVLHPFDFTRAEKIDLAAFHAEINLNFSSGVTLATEFLPFLMSKPSTLIFVGSHVGFVPMPNMPAYSASKAALSAFALCLREQLRPTSVKVVELWPPVIRTELTQRMGEGQSSYESMTMAEFVEQANKALAAGEDEIVVGEGPAPKDVFNPVLGKRREMFENMAGMMRGPHGS